MSTSINELEEIVENNIKQMNIDLPTQDNKIMKIEESNDINDITIDVSKLLVNDKTSSIDYYKYVCKQLAVTSNLDLYNQFYEYFIKADDYTRLGMITNSDYVTDILYNEFKD